jgi:hypothetical protein
MEPRTRLLTTSIYPIRIPVEILPTVSGQCRRILYLEPNSEVAAIYDEAGELFLEEADVWAVIMESVVLFGIHKPFVIQDVEFEIEKGLFYYVSGVREYVVYAPAQAQQQTTILTGEPLRPGYYAVLVGDDHAFAAMNAYCTQILDLVPVCARIVVADYANDAELIHFLRWIRDQHRVRRALSRSSTYSRST